VVTVRAQAGCDLEAVGVGELHIEEDDVGTKPCHGLERLSPVYRLADDVEAAGRQPPSGCRPEGVVVVDDEYSLHDFDAARRQTRLPSR